MAPFHCHLLMMPSLLSDNGIASILFLIAFVESPLMTLLVITV